ncbi:MAG: MarR family transcriptional regulator [Actinobacteria bacterium]|nr:MarR family transcriptional regulator [Actinomycetota bacterium]
MADSLDTRSKTNPAPDLVERYADKLVGSLRCFDRVILQGTLVDVAHPGAVAVQLRAAGLELFDLPRFAQQLTDQVRDHAVLLGREHGVTIEYVQKKNIRQEDRIAQILKVRGSHPGLVHIFSAKEAGTVFETRKNKETGAVRLIARRGTCLHYYFYWMHARLGLIYVRVQSWLPMRLQVYWNGHSWLACELKQAGIDFHLQDNAFASCGDWKRAQELADGLTASFLHEQLKELAQLCCPAAARFANGYHWSFAQVEYAQDLVFKEAGAVEAIFEDLARHALLTIKAEDVARILGRRVPSNQPTQLNSHLGRRHAGLRLKHSLGPASFKLYNKPGGILRIEGTTYDVSFFKHYRTVVHRDGTQEGKVAPLRKGLYGLADLTHLLGATVQRYSQWLAALTDQSAGRSDLDKLSRPAKDSGQRSYRGFNLFLAGILRPAA